jgi:hypothetical protein
MKRTKIGGVLAAVANKAGIGKVVRPFPPQAMLSDGERARASVILKEKMHAAKVARAAPGRVVKASPSSPPPPEPIVAPAGNGATGEAVVEDAVRPGYEPAMPLAVLGAAVALMSELGAADPKRDAMGLLRGLARDRSLPASVRVSALDGVDAGDRQG